MAKAKKNIVKTKVDKDTVKYVNNQLLLVLGVILAGLVLFCIGLMVGYGVIGDGKNVWDILTPSKWQEIIGKFTGK